MLEQLKMLATGTIDPDARTFDIEGVDETDTSIAVIGSTLRLSYRDPEGQLVQLTKTITTADGVGIGDAIGLSPATQNGLRGYAQKTNEKGVATALTAVDWANLAGLTSKTFIDDHGHNRVAVLMPVVLK